MPPKGRRSNSLTEGLHDAVYNATKEQMTQVAENAIAEKGEGGSFVLLTPCLVHVPCCRRGHHKGLKHREGVQGFADQISPYPEQPQKGS